MQKLPSNLYVLFLFIGFLGFSQSPKKTLHTKFCSEKITIDGKLNEGIWATTEIATDFMMTNPDNGKPESKDRKTEVKVVYDNDAIYIGAVLYDNEPNKIRKELTSRDNWATADMFISTDIMTANKNRDLLLVLLGYNSIAFTPTLMGKIILGMPFGIAM